MGIFGPDKIIVHDTKVVRERVPYVKEIHEHRAPTDDSIRIMHEQVDKAKREVLKAFEIKDNTLKADFAIFRDEISTDVKLIGRIFINGEEYKIESKIDYNPSRSQDAIAVALGHAIGKITNKIKEEIINKFCKEIKP